MAGHSQFKNIMHRKGAQDAKRGKIFTKLSREISVAVKEGGDNPDFNPRLRNALMAARGANMPKDNIDKAIKKASAADYESFESITYEGYGPFKVAIIVEALTNNRNRTSSEVRSIFNKHNGSMGASGSVSFQFEHKGCIKFVNEGVDFEKLFETAVDLGAQDVLDGEEILVLTDLKDLYSITKSLQDKLQLTPVASEFSWFPVATVDLSQEQMDSLCKIIHALEESDDVQRVFTNAVA